MSIINNRFAGRHVTVISGGAGSAERTDTGTLTETDGNWVHLVKDNGEALLFPSTAIRVIKLLDEAPNYPVAISGNAGLVQAAPVHETPLEPPPVAETVP